MIQNIDIHLFKLRDGRWGARIEATAIREDGAVVVHRRTVRTHTRSPMDVARMPPFELALNDIREACTPPLETAIAEIRAAEENHQTDQRRD